MKKVITLTAYNRPQYLKLLLESLSNNNLNGYECLYINIEPRNRKVIDICKHIDFIPTKIRINPTRYGVRKNPYMLFDRCFNDGNYFTVYLEDDIILSPDTFDLANYYCENFKEDQYLLLSFCNYLENGNDCNKIIEYNDFIAIGFCFFSYSWYNWMKPYWFEDSITEGIGGVGWDWSLRSVMKKFKLKTLTPSIARSNHMGVIGTHCGPKTHQKLFGSKIHYTGSESNFYLEV